MKKIKQFLFYLKRKLFSMSYYEEADLMRLTDLLKREVFPNRCLPATFPIEQPNEISCIYYVIALPNGDSYTIKIVFDNAENYQAHLELFETNQPHLDTLEPLLFHLNNFFKKNILRICDLFVLAKNAKSNL